MGDPSKLKKQKYINKIFITNFVNIIDKTGHCMSSTKKPHKFHCGNQINVVWRIIPVGLNEYNIKSDSGLYLTNKNGLNKSGNPIIAIPAPKGRDNSNVWSFTPVGNGEYVIYNTFTRKCLDTTNKTNYGSGFKLNKCQERLKNNNQLWSLNIVKPEKNSKKKSDP